MLFFINYLFTSKASKLSPLGVCQIKDRCFGWVVHPALPAAPAQPPLLPHASTAMLRHEASQSVALQTGLHDRCTRDRSVSAAVADKRRFGQILRLVWMRKDELHFFAHPFFPISQMSLEQIGCTQKKIYIYIYSSSSSSL